MTTLCVGCDFGLVKSGIVLINNDFEIESQNLIRTKHKGAARLVEVEMGFDSIVRPYLPMDLELFVEGYAYGAKYQRESLAELGGVMRRYFHLTSITHWVIPPTTLKLFVTGTGRASKNYMKKCTKEQWDKVFKTDDVCDAYGLSRLGMHVMKSIRGDDTSEDLLPHQREIVKEILLHPDYYKNSSTSKKRPRKKKTNSNDETTQRTTKSLSQD